MNRSSAIARIQRGLGMRTDQVDNIIYALQEEQRSLEMGKTLPWFLRAEDQPIAITQGVQSYNLPTDFLRPIDDEPMRYTTSGSTSINYVERKEMDKALTTYADSNASGPKVWVLRMNSMYFLPNPDRAYSLLWTYYKRGASLDADIENVWLANAPDVVISGAGLRMALDLRDQDAVKIFTSMQADAKVALFKEIVAREEAARMRYKGGR